MVNCDLLTKRDFKTSDYNLLIIEDSSSFNKILMTEFTKDGFNCFSSTTLKEAYDILKKHEIHYLLLDINLPDGNGYELIKKLEDTPEKIFVLTNESDKQFREISYQKGVIDYIIKDKSFFYKIHQVTATIEQLEKNKFKTILIVDDSFIIQEQLKDILTNRYYNVKIASNTKDALDVITNNNIDLMFLDIHLDKENGIEFLEKNHQFIIDIKKIATIIVSGSVDAITVRDGLKAGAVDIIRKPYVIEEIVLKADLWVDYKRKEEEILCTNQILQEYKDTVDEASIISKADPKGIITYVNDKFCQLSGYKKEELIGKSHNIVRHPDTPKETFKDMWHTIKKLKKTWHGNVKNRKKDGSYYWVEAYIKPIIDIQGNIVEFIGLRNDITEFEDNKKYLHENLESSNYMLHQFQDAIENNNAIARVDLELIITYVNDRYTTLSKYSHDELLGKFIFDIFDFDGESLSSIPEILETIQKGNTFQGIIKGKRKDQTHYYIKSTIKPLKNIDNEIIEYLIINTDITEEILLHEEIENTQKEIIYTMGAIGETRSKETGDHVKRVAEYSYLFAKLVGLSDKEAEILKMASPMHDIGKIGIPDEILNKPGKLTPEEFEKIKQHSNLGYEMLKGSSREILQASAILAHQHHEKWDGSGYPKGLQGEDIHIFGRITAIADVFDALGHDRCYKKGWELEKIYQFFEENKGTHFDPNLIDIFFENKEKFLEIKKQYD